MVHSYEGSQYTAMTSMGWQRGFCRCCSVGECFGQVVTRRMKPAAISMMTSDWYTTIGGEPVLLTSFPRYSMSSNTERVASVYTKGGDSLCRDINYICSASRWVWLAAVLDVYWRSDVHWSLTHRVDGKLSVNAVEVAFERRRRQDEVTFHLDQDSQYAGIPRRLWRYRMVQRMCIAAAVWNLRHV